MNRNYPHPIIAREGWPILGGGLIVSLLVTMCGGWWSLPFWIFTVFALQFFRDPERPVPQDADAVLSPVDGRIVVVERAEDPYRRVEALKISIFMNVFNVHSQKSPVDGTVTAVEYNKGKFLNADLDKASVENERNAVLATTASGREITFVQVAGLVARRILCYTKVGDKLARGERYGFIRFGSRVDVYLPVDARAMVAIGEKVTGVQTVLARLPQQAEQDSESDRAEEAVSHAPSQADSEQEMIAQAAEKIRQAVQKVAE
ncbi:phosphatidylserine decarboxylase [Neisseria animalis]|uniref:Phosphatidylserine decarboxylase proenzyme n=1 Tax=Neisseria animalis TaxID=492 RepID=A0A5P3MT37_NEIAN|nr:phosphatidylserine decarboxylase [Neisseria animalis]QEY24620.1 phosphatidylserine decarboxylase [Neisseria animalis]ROW32968.1 phosphatidylserine decarboxylase [Neisseria animalis]VEE07491.1 phosphatidylserine decarboxylase [Neisseria animalis]